MSEILTAHKVLVEGASGTGKTHLVGTLAGLVPTLVVTADPDGLETLRQMPLLPETEIILVAGWENIWEQYKEIAGKVETLGALALDDFGSLQDTSRRKIDRAPRTPKEEQGGAGAELAIRQGLMLGERRMQIQQWGELWIALDAFLYEVLKLPYRLKLVTVLEGKAKNPRTGEEHLYPDLAGQMRTSILARFGLVAETFISYDRENRPLYCLHSRGHPRIETKDRYSPGGRTWVNPTAERLIAHLGRGGEKETEQEKRIGTGL